MNRLIDFALVRPLAVLLLALALSAAGVLAWLALPVDAFPDVSSPQVKIILKAPGMTPEEVEARITAPIEVEMLGLPKQSMLRSMSKYGLADITVDFNEGTDIYWARNQVAERLGGVMADLPAGVTGGVAPLTTPLGEMFMFTIESDTASLAERRRLLDWTIRPALRTVPGVADVNALGGHVESFEVVPAPTALAARGISASKRCGWRWKRTTATTALAAWPKARRRCWCAPKAACARWTTFAPWSCSARPMAAWSGSAMSPKCGWVRSPATAA